MKSYFTCTTTNDGNKEIQHELPVTPESFNLGMGSQFSEQSTLGRSHPLSAFSGTNSRSFSFSFTVHRDAWEPAQIEGTSQGMDRSGYLDDLLLNLSKTVYPEYKSGKIIPPITKFSFGEFFFIGTVNSINFSPLSESQQKNGKYSAYSISITMTSIYDDEVPHAGNMLSFYQFGG